MKTIFCQSNFTPAKFWDKTTPSLQTLYKDNHETQRSLLTTQVAKDAWDLVAIGYHCQSEGRQNQAERAESNRLEFLFRHPPEPQAPQISTVTLQHRKEASPQSRATNPLNVDTKQVEIKRQIY